MPEIVVIGSSNTDMVIYADHLPQPGETLLGGRFFMNPGGKGANQAVAAARLGGKVTFIARTGSDLFGQEAISNFVKEGINTRFILTDTVNPSGVALITVDSAGENSIVVAPGANMALVDQDIDRAEACFHNAGIALMQLEIPMATVLYAAHKAFLAGIKVVLNPAPAQELPEELYPFLFAITPNESEASILSGIAVRDMESAAEASGVFHRKGVKNVIITMGASGAFLSSEGKTLVLPAPKVTAVDTTAAGDTFNGALCVALCQGMGIDDAVMFANKAAAISVTREGAQASVPDLKEMDDFFK